jgi:hypothetical protein
VLEYVTEIDKTIYDMTVKSKLFVFTNQQQVNQTAPVYFQTYASGQEPQNNFNQPSSRHKSNRYCTIDLVP